MPLTEKQIEAYNLVEELERKNRSLYASNRNYRMANVKLRARIKEQNAQLSYAALELAKRKPEILSQEEWNVILEMRGICR